ncbi:hypothetical protein ACFQZQ_06180 [Lysobacter koreensis]|uniref:Protein sip-5 n=1 Tax=Lysobacter koreensis TaxID=266122 RepID=A0ABW2YMH8_9GAMM
MSFDKLINKVTQAENALEARERRVSDSMDRFKVAWRAGWTPGRIVIAGLVTGFLVGRAEPLRSAARGGGLVQVVTMLSGLFAGGSAQVAAGEAQHAARNAEQVADAVAPGSLPGGPLDAQAREADALAREAADVHAARSAFASTDS